MTAVGPDTENPCPFITKGGRLLNADVNGSLNVIRKLFGKEVRDAPQGEPVVGALVPTQGVGRKFRHL